MGYLKYYDRYSNKKIPRSTKYCRKKRESVTTCNNQPMKVRHLSTNRSNTLDDYFITTPTNDEQVAETLSFEKVVNVEPTKANHKSSPNEHFQNHLHQPTCACENVNVGETLLMFLSIAKKHALTWVTIIDIFETLNCVFNRNIFPVTKYMINKLMQINQEDLITYHILCTTCNRHISKISNSTCKCGAKVNSNNVHTFFAQLNIRNQLENLFLNESVLENIFHRFTRKKQNENALEDIYDGSIYKNYVKQDDLLGNKMNFSYTINTDGCQASDASKISIWPIYLMLHELPEHLRKKHMILAGLWVAKKEPIMNLYLKSFVDQANRLSTEGFKFYWKGEEKIGKVFPLGCCVDSPARCAMLSMKRFNGTDGCTYCEHPTVAIEGVRKYPMITPPPIQRTNSSIKEKMLIAYISDSQDITGIKGPSSFMNLKHFDLVNGMVVDYMHACLLGVTELYTTIILTNAKEEYYVGSPAKLHIIDQRLLAIRPPNCIAKVSRSIKERANWTASEWLTWLIFYSLICLNGILPTKYYNNLSMFVCAMNILLGDSITPKMLEQAKKLLIRFVVHFEMLYGTKYMHYNVHLLTHLADTVKNWGPLYCVNTFPFENENKLLLRMKKCNYRISQQIISRLLVYQQLPLLLQNSEYISDKIRLYCNNLDKNKLKNICRVDDCILIGSGKLHTLSERELQCLENIIDVHEITECRLYEKIIYNRNRYTINKHQRTQRNNNSIIQLVDNRFGIITKIFKIECSNTTKVFIYFNCISVNNFFINDIEVPHFKIVNTENQINADVVECTKLTRPCLLLKLRKQFFVITIVKGILGKDAN